MEFELDRQLVHVRYELRQALAEGRHDEAPALLARLRHLSITAALLDHQAPAAGASACVAALHGADAVDGVSPRNHRLGTDHAEPHGEIDRWRARFGLE